MFHLMVPGLRLLEYHTKAIALFYLFHLLSLCEQMVGEKWYGEWSLVR